MADISPQVRSAAARALGSFSADPEIQALREGLRDSDPWVVSSAVMALGRCGGRLAVPALIDAMDHRSSAVVISAIQALGRMVPDSLSLVISKGLEKEDPEVVRETISLIRFYRSEMQKVSFDHCWSMHIGTFVSWRPRRSANARYM